MKKNQIKRWCLISFLLCGSYISSVLMAQTCQPDSIIASTPEKFFIDNQDGTITDTRTGLMWKRCSEGQAWDGINKACTGTVTTFTWIKALQQVESLNAVGGFATYIDWRLPNVKELSSIVEVQCFNPAINLVLFPGVSLVSAPPYWWTSSIAVNDAAKVWTVRFVGGSNQLLSKTAAQPLRLVREN